MNEDLKYGKKYRLELLCKSQTKNIIVFETPTGDLLPLRANDLECVSPIPERENTESAHKYDPCRKFRKGDIVRVVEWNGRDIARVGQIGHVVSNEINSRVELSIDGWSRDVYYPACNLELVTPVEHLEPYSVGGSIDGCVLYKNGEFYAEFVNSSDAEKTCKLLNAEHRKENEQ